MIEIQDDEITSVLRSSIHSFALAEMWPMAESIDKSGQVPADMWQKIDDLGFTRPEIGEEYLTPYQYLVVAEELGRGDPAIALGALSKSHLAFLLYLCEPKNVPESLLSKLGDETIETSLYLYEGFGRSPDEFLTTATSKNDNWTITGQKYVVGGPALPDLAAVLARDASDGSLKLFLIDAKESEGITVERDGEKVASCGLGGGAPVSRVRLENVNSAVELNTDAETLLRAISLVRLTPAAVMVGATARGIEYSAEYANERIAFGKPISQHQGVSFMLADASMSLDAVRMALQDATNGIDNKDDAQSISDLVSRICNDTFSATLQATRDCVQVLGGHGFIKDHPVERLYRAAVGIASLDTELRSLIPVTTRIS